MARKRHIAEQELPFVALMDTMTNVVGVLTIVLVMIGISLARAASRVFSALPPATAEQLRVAQAEGDRLRAGQELELARLKEPDKTAVPPLELATIDTEIARLEQSAREKGIKLFDLDALNRERARREEELKQKKTSVEQMLAEKDRLKAQLDATPVTVPPPAKNVRIPASRPIPAGAVIERVIVTKDGAYWVDVAGAREALLRVFNSSLNAQLEHHRVKRGRDSVIIYDHAKLAKYFSNRKTSFRDFSMTVTNVSWTANPVVKLVPRVPSSDATLQATLRRFKGDPKTVVMFRVTGDGFERYLAVREACDRIGVAAGWEFAGSPEYQFAVSEIQTTRPVEPPRPAPPDAIKSPSQKLD
jgi:hypothetical protein